MKPWLVCLAALLAACSSPPPDDSFALDVEWDAITPAEDDEPGLEEWMQRFESEGREIYERRFDILEAAQVREGMEIVHVGAGTGLFTFMLSQAVGDTGRVYAVDIVHEFVDLIRERAAARKALNIEGVVCSPRSVMMPSQSVDLAFLCDVYRYFDYPKSSMASIHRALRPGGQLVVIDFLMLPGISTPWVLEEAGHARREFIAEIEAHGFQLLEDLPILQESFFLRFQRVDPGS